MLLGNIEGFRPVDAMKGNLAPLQERTFNYNDFATGDNVSIDAGHFSKTEDAKEVDEFLSTLNDIFEENQYHTKVIAVNMADNEQLGNMIFPLAQSRNFIGALLRYLSLPGTNLSKYNGIKIVFYKGEKYFILDCGTYNKDTDYKILVGCLEQLMGEWIIDKRRTYNFTGDDGSVSKSTPSLKGSVDSKEVAEEEVEANKKRVVQMVANKIDSEDTTESPEDAISDEQIAAMISSIQNDDPGTPRLSKARTSRMTKLNDAFLDKMTRGVSNRQLVSAPDLPPEMQLVVEPIKVDSINADQFAEQKFTSFNSTYNPDKDISACMYRLSQLSYPISIVDLNVEDTSTVMDYVYTYKYKLEDSFGKQFTLTFDFPKFINSRFMKLRGNQKTLNGQLLLMPCLKTDTDTVQVVSNYNKIFIRLAGMANKSTNASDVLGKVLGKIADGKVTIPNFKVTRGDNSSVCSIYELPVDYVDIASQFNRVETKDWIYFFDQGIYYEVYNADKSQGIPYAVNKQSGTILYYKGNDNATDTGSYLMTQVLMRSMSMDSNAFRELCESTKPAKRLAYSQASIMASHIPLVVVIGYGLGLSKLIRKIGLPDNEAYGWKDKRPSININSDASYIKFADGYFVYPNTYVNSILFSGLDQVDCSVYKRSEVDSRSMWLDFLDQFGGRILADGLDNFEELFLDPITQQVCKECHLPTDYYDLLLYGNALLADTAYNRHVDITGNRYRSNEIVAGYFYKCLCRSYEEYKLNIRRGRRANASLSMKRSAVIDAVLSDPMSSDLSTLTPLLEVEMANTVSFKGLSGMNADRAYSLDKRTFDDSMINKVALSTGFASNVGIVRQTTIDMQIEGERGYIKPTKKDDMSITKTFSMSEAVTPFCSTHNDPFRTAMTFIQSTKHSMLTEKSSPTLITNGADQAMVHMVSDTYAFKAKANGVVKEVTADYILIQYDNGTSDYVDTTDKVEKNSDGGFYVPMKLDADVKPGQKIKQGDVLAHNPYCFSRKVGESDMLTYQPGLLTKIAIMNTDEGFEDSCSIDTWLSEALASRVIAEVDCAIGPMTNVYDIVKIGQSIQEGEPLIIFQNEFDEKDANILLKNITDGDMVSDLGRIRKKSKYTGIVKDIKIYRTCEIDELSESLQKIVNEYERGIKAKRAFYKKNKIHGEQWLEPDHKMEPTGRLKDVDGVKFFFYIEYFDQMGIGDKVVAEAANKGVSKYIIPEGDECYSEFRPEEHVHAFFAARSFNARMVCSPWISGAINKTMIELDRRVKKELGIPVKPIEDIE
ncbi:hypothetical protein [uncultured Duncaniella sp.]|uniref:hypothetical protein n=1 Tax=uncultured Duncaniella sp. TaxID=2768039 RepID=UPI002630AC7B|nr:hypothetical protein [uncultured Duncaniella sp.]